ncbi:MAG: fructose-bisphosphatase class III [Candidatus Saganbacteria bacterium]|nr:fructose-bisphosphatase class III [Candidatus Saganbacteria bacterium]
MAVNPPDHVPPNRRAMKEREHFLGTLKPSEVFMERVVALTKTRRTGKVAIPDYVGTPGMVLVSDSHGEVERYACLYEALPSTVKYAYDLGDKVDRGPNPVETMYLLQTLEVQRGLGNHDAMWLAAGLGVPAQAIELVRWLMRYNEVNFLTSGFGIDLRPLQRYAEKYFPSGTHRIEVKSTISPSLEAAATYLKIITEATVRFPEHEETILNESEIRIRQALFFNDAEKALAPGELEVFKRLVSGNALSAEDRILFYRLMGGVRELNEAEEGIVKHVAGEFLRNYPYFNFVKWMIGEGDLYFTFRERQGYPCDILATHALIPIDEHGELLPIAGKVGRECFLDLKRKIKLGIESWRQYLDYGSTLMLDMHRATIDTLGMLPWDKSSPVYGREMATAARALLPEGSGLWKEPEVPFFTVFEKAADPAMLARAKVNIAKSFEFQNPDNFVIVRGHKPSKDGKFQVLAGGTVINIDGGMAANYGGKSGAIVFGSKGAAWLDANTMTFTRVQLPCDRIAG